MATAITERPTDPRRPSGHYRAYTPKPFTRAERDSVTVLFGGLHWRVERILQAVLESAGHKAQVLPVATKDDLLTGREVADIGQCCPTSFTTGNLVNFLKKEAKATSAAEVNQKFVYLTAGSCGACRFGQYHQSYELALRNSGLDAFRMFLLAQDQLPGEMEHQISHLIPDPVRVPLAQGVVEFEHFLDQIGTERGTGLDPVPRAPSAQVPDDAESASKR
jgi:hypothetical protein